MMFSLSVRNLRIRTYPKTTIDATSEMLGKLAINLFIDFLCSLVGMDCSCYILSLNLGDLVMSTG